MIKFEITNKIRLYFNSNSDAIFQGCVGTAKNNRLRFNPKESCWIVPTSKFDMVLDQFRDIEEVEITPDNHEKNLLALKSPTRELEYKEGRITPDYDLVNFPPFKGKAPYEDFQKIDIKMGLQRNVYAFFLEMGLGKSYIMAVIAAHYLIKWKIVSKVLVLSSNTGARNLPEEFSKFIKEYSGLNAILASKYNRKPFDPDVDIVFSSYNTFRLISKAYQKTNSSKPRKAFIPFKEWFGDGEGLLLLDESHMVANPSSQQGNFVAIHAPDFKYRYLGTGTPADKPEKLYNQLRILDKALIHGFSFSEWKEYYANLGNRYSATAISSWKQDKLEELNKEMQEYCVFRKSEDTIDLPENIETPIYCTLTPAHRKIYETFVSYQMESNKYESGGYNVRDIVNLFPYLSIALHNPKLLAKHSEKFEPAFVKAIESFKLEKDADSIEALKGLIEDMQGEKGIVWVVHPDTAITLAEVFKKKNPIVITGRTDSDDRPALIDTFRNNKTHELLIANIDVLSTSYTITEAKWQIYLERHFNYTAFSQSKKRIHRIGQDKNVRTFYMIYKNSLDVLLDANLRGKGKLVEGLVSKEFLTEDEWKDIFNPAKIGTF